MGCERTRRYADSEHSCHSRKDGLATLGTWPMRMHDHLGGCFHRPPCPTARQHIREDALRSGQLARLTRCLHLTRYPRGRRPRAGARFPCAHYEKKRRLLRGDADSLPTKTPHEKPKLLLPVQRNLTALVTMPRSSTLLRRGVRWKFAQGTTRSRTKGSTPCPAPHPRRRVQ